MNEIVFIPIPPQPPVISPFEISSNAKLKSNNFKFEEILFGQNNIHIPYQNVNGVLIKNCSNVEDALQILKLQWLMEKFNQFADLFMIIFEIEASIDSLESATILKLMKNFRNKFLIILLKTFSGKCQIFWKFDDKIFWLKMDPEVSNFVLDFLAASVTSDHPGVPNDMLTLSNSKDQIFELDLLSLKDTRSYNLLMLAAEDGDASVVDSLIQHGFDVNVLIDDETAIDRAYGNKHYDIVLALLHANSLFPRNFNNSQLTDELKKFIGISRELHNSIRQGKREEIESILDDNPNLRHFYNTKNLSAASQAVICGELEIYDILLSKSVYIGPKEDFNAILRKVSQKSCENMRGIHLGYIQSSSDKHLMILTVNSFVGHDTPDVDEKLKHITKAFNFLNQVDPLISLILKVVAASRDFKIIFDFHRQSIQHLDPTSSQFTRGVYHTSRHIYIAAQHMLDPDTVHEIYGTMAHELCHYALHLVYHNDCRPYYHNEWNIIEKFTKIALFCKLRQDRENLIACVFNFYPKDLQHAELIVRVPHMIAEYSNRPEKLEENRQIFPELFQFAENITAVDMENSLTDIEIQAEDEIKKFANRVKKQERENFRLWILSIFCIFTMPLMIYYTIWMSNTSSKPVYNCTNLTDQRYKVMESTVNFQGVPVIFQDLFGNGTDSCTNLTSDEIGKMLDIYDYNQFIDPKENVYKEGNDKNIIKNGQETDDNANIFDTYRNFRFRQPSLNVSSKVTFKSPFYIGRRVYQKKGGGIIRNVFSFDELKNGKIVIFSDLAGNGKSTTFRRAAWKLKKILPLYWVSYVDLKDYVEPLKGLTLNNTDKPEIVDFISNKILKLTSDVDRKIFNQKFSTNNVILLWDGVDEISPICTENILGLVEKISNVTENRQWISTRVHLEGRIASKFERNGKVYALSYYNQTERLNFIRKFLEIHKITNETAKIIEKKMNSTILRLENRGTSRNIENRELNTPLMISMICEYQLAKFEEDNDKNTTNISTDSTNIYTFYEFFMNKKFEIAYKNKSNIVMNDLERVKDEFGYNDIHQLYALKEILGAAQLKDVVTNANINFNNLSLVQYFQESKNHLTNEQITRLGILYENSAGLLKFEHRTFAEFFVAQYFYMKLWDPNLVEFSNDEIKLRLQILLSIIKNDEQFKVILDFIIGFLEVKRSKSPNSFGKTMDKIIDEDYGKLFYFFDFKSDCISIATKFFKKDKKIVGKLWKIDENFTFFQETFNYYSVIEYFDDLRKIVVDNFDENDQSKILNGNNQQIYILFRIWGAQYNHTDYYKTIPNLDVIYENLTRIEESQIVEFLDLMDKLNYSKSEFRDFFRQTLSETVLQFTADDIVSFKNYWHFIQQKLDSKDIKLILFHKQIITDQSILFQIRQLKSEFLKIVFNYIESNLNESEILNLLLLRERKENATILSYEVDSFNNQEALNLTWNFIKNHTTEEQQKDMLSSFNGHIRTLKTVWNTKNTEIFKFYKNIFMIFFTKPKLCDMITELIENMEIFAMSAEDHNKDESDISRKRREFLEEIFEGDEKRLGNVYSGVLDMYIR